MKQFHLVSNRDCTVIKKDNKALMHLKIDDEGDKAFTAWALVLGARRVHGRDLYLGCEEMWVTPLSQ